MVLHPLDRVLGVRAGNGINSYRETAIEPHGCEWLKQTTGLVKV
jgi:hypothetical protein